MPSAERDRDGTEAIPGNKGNRVACLRNESMHPRMFEETVLPHIDAAFNYARWLTRNDAEAEDLVRDACVREMRFFSSLRDDDARAWLFTIVRNSWYSRVSRRAKVAARTPLNDAQDQWPDSAIDPEERLLQQHTVGLVRAALEQLPRRASKRMRVRPAATASIRSSALSIDAGGPPMRIGACTWVGNREWGEIMTDTKYAELKQMLEVRQRELQRALDVKLRDVRANNGHDGQIVGALDDADASNADLLRDIGVTLTEMTAQALVRIDEAPAR